MQDDTLISIIVPAYNVVPFLQRCLDSVVSQTYKNLEIICVDDGSTDGTGELLDSYAQQDARIRVLHKANAGVTPARMDGVATARGEWIGFVDADDAVEPNMYERLLNNALLYDAEISHCGHEVWCEGKDPVQLVADIKKLTVENKAAVIQLDTGQHLVRQDAGEGLKDLLQGSYEPGLCNKLYNSSLLHRLLHSGLMDCFIKNNEDLLMNYYLFKEANRVVYEDFCPYNYIKREGSASRRKRDEHLTWDPIRVKEIIRADCVGTPLENAARAAYLNTCINGYNGCIDAGSAQDDMRRIRELICDNIKDVGLLPWRRSLIACGIAYAPWAYCVVRKCYIKSGEK